MPSVEKFTELENMQASIFAIASHSHIQNYHQHNAGQLSLPQNGVIYLIANNQLFIIPPGMAIFIPPNIEHCIYQASKRTIIENVYFKDEYQNLLPRKTQSIHLSNLAKALVAKLCSFPNSMFNSLQVKNILVVLLDELNEKVNQTEYFVQIPKNTLLKQIFDLFAHSIDHFPTLTKAASYINVSNRTLQRMVKEDIGISFIVWKQQLVFAKALELLQLYKRTSIVTYKLGYNSESAFISMFKKMSGGKLPSEF